MSPDRDTFSYILPELYNENGEIIDASRHPEDKVKFKLDKEVFKFDMMKTKK